MKKLIPFALALAAIGLVAEIIRYQPRQSYNITTAQDQVASLRMEQVMNNLNLIASR